MSLKIKLDLDALSVESFTTSDVDAKRGTVHGHISDTTCYQRLCDCGNSYGLYCTREITCPNTCDASCDGTCNSCNGTCFEDTCQQYCTTGPVIVCSCSPTP